MQNNYQPPAETNQHETCLLGYLAHQHITSPWLRLAQPSMPYTNTDLCLTLHPISEAGKTPPPVLTVPSHQLPQRTPPHEFNVATSPQR